MIRTTLRTRAIAGLLLAGAMLVAPALASSHREAPGITRTPKVDATDYYLFNSYESGRSGFVTVVANYVPLQDTYGGPNYFQLDPNAIYELKFDNNGDAVEDLTFQFRFKNTSKNISLDIGGKQVAIPLVDAGQVFANDSSALNVTESFTVDVIRGATRTHNLEVAGQVTNQRDGSATFIKPVDNIGNKTLPDYAAYAAQYLYDIRIPGCATSGRLFVGQRKDPFVVNLGETFDLVNYKNVLGPVDGERDDLDDKNVTSIVMELPASCLTAANDPVIAGWTTARLTVDGLTAPGGAADAGRLTRRGPATTGARDVRSVQVSRLSNPLVNELVIGLKDKDRFNSSEPADDAQFATYVTNPTLPKLIEILFAGAGVKAPTLYPRTDLVAAFLTGIDGLNKTKAVAEFIRLNTSTPAKPREAQNNLGVIGGDTSGFPNGRRPGDDVVDIALRVVMGKLLSTDLAPSGQLPYTDGAYVDATHFDDHFPYLKTPLAGSPQH